MGAFGPEFDPDPVVVTPHEEDGKVHFDWQQPGWDSLVEGVGVIRNNRLARPLSWGRAELEIPVGILHFLKKACPDLDSKDMEIKTRAWKLFAASPLSLPFRVNPTGRSVARSVGGLKDGRQSSGTDGQALPDVSTGQGNGPEAGAGLCGGEGGHQPSGGGDQSAHLGDP